MCLAYSPSSGILLSLKEQGHSDTWYSMDEPEDTVLNEIARHKYRMISLR